jgi:acyl dehydratase
VIRYFEDYAEGVTVECGSVTMNEAAMIAFATEYDPQSFHVDPSVNGPFGGLIASGWHTISVVMRQLVDNYLSPESSLGAAGVDEVRWPAPVRPGDTLRVRATVTSARRSKSKPDRGVIRTLIEAVNQDNITVLTLTAINFMLTRPAPT